MADYRVMIVDDEDRIRKGMKKLLEEIIGGYRVVAEAGNGVKALECLSTTQVDVIFTDMRMPEMDGIEFIKKVKTRLPQVPIFVLSGYDDYEYMRHAIKNNVTDYILKPLDRIELVQSLNKLNEILGSRISDESPSQEAVADNNTKRQIIRNVKEIIGENLHKDISLQAIAEEVGYSYTHLSALFKIETGQPFTEYLIKTRIDKAKQLLKDTNLKIYEIGNLCGYPNSKYFMSIFKEAVGMTPSEFRDNL